jgi:hypothetical protein
MKAFDLIRYIVWYATQRGMKLTTTRVVKFVYLADLFYARSTGGKTLTDFPWKFIHYGPYCPDVMAELEFAAKGNLIFEDRRESKFGDKDYFLYTCQDTEAENIESEIPTSVLSPLRESIKLFGEDTQALLDHVYFETEPMSGVRKGDLLDFSKVVQTRIQKLPTIPKLPKEKIKEAKRRVQRLVEQMENDWADLRKDSISYPEPMDEVHIRALEIMDGEGVAEGTKGSAEIIPE